MNSYLVARAEEIDGKWRWIIKSAPDYDTEADAVQHAQDYIKRNTDVPNT